MTFTHAKRLLLIYWKGSFKERFPNKCKTCNRRSIFIEHDSIVWTGIYSPCGHRYDLWLELRNARAGAQR